VTKKMTKNTSRRMHVPVAIVVCAMLALIGSGVAIIREESKSKPFRTIENEDRVDRLRRIPGVGSVINRYFPKYNFHCGCTAMTN
jgi:hypothetical protein